jgi:major vault protein
MSSERRTTSNELVLSDGEYAYTQDATSGIIKTHTGPLVVNITGQENPVVYRSELRRFERVELERAAQPSPLTPQGAYCVLWNPAVDKKHPDEKGKTISPGLLMGQRVHIPGPNTFALWPRQSAKVIQGHHLRSNQYLLVRIYDEEAARASWKQAVVKRATTLAGVGEGELEVAGSAPRDLSVGRLIVIRGTEVSFYIPPTGVEVVESAQGEYVRDALTLERLEYCILIDEDGNKRYERGPAVVFPRPTEHFYEEVWGEERVLAFRPIELSPVQGIHVKVIADYVDEGGVAHKEGDELFITGSDTPIYFPRQEHSLVSYDGSTKHFAVAVPAGEARYVMSRKSGEIRLAQGPTMLLPNPCEEIIVRRALSDEQCRLWYPGNEDALGYNRTLRQLAQHAPTTRHGAVSEGQLRQRRRGGRDQKNVQLEETVMQSSASTRDATAVMADEFSYNSTFNAPRTLTLHTRFAGVPVVQVWTGYAVMVVSKDGQRRVEEGPARVLLAYDEELEVLSQSEGVPKDAGRRSRSPYLKVRHQEIEDQVQVETRDHVQVTLRVAMRVDFEGAPERWFAVENYVQLLCDRARKALKGRARQVDVEALYSDPDGLVRGALLGELDAQGARPGLAFVENGMRVTEAEVRGLELGDERVWSLMEQARHQSVRAGIELAAARRKLEVDRTLEEMARALKEAQAETARHKAALERQQIERELSVTVARLKASIQEEQERLEIQRSKDAVADAGHMASLARKEKNAALERSLAEAEAALSAMKLEAETQATVARLGAVQAGFSEALLALGSQETLVKVADAMSVQQLLGGRNLPEVIGRVFENTPLEEAMRALQARATPKAG